MFLYDISAFILYFIFYFFFELGLFLKKFFIMTSPHYYDVTHFLTNPNENCTAYVKLKIRHFVLENFFIFQIFIEKIMIYYKNHV